jgi:1-acyl-sn-glycerol-3-phosphate acyltransferase
LQLTTHGELYEGDAVLYVANHISYIDIFVMGGVLPGYFIAKSEVASWPVLGWLAKCQNTLFFERKSGRAAEQIKVMREYLHTGKSLILYPEGTSTSGAAVQRFKSSLFKAAEPEPGNTEHRDDVMVQAVTIAYTHYLSQPMAQEQRDLYAWHGDMEFAPHFLKMLSAKGCEVELHFHKPVKVSEFESRKALASYCEAEVAGGLHKAIAE